MFGRRKPTPIRCQPAPLSPALASPQTPVISTEPAPPAGEDVTAELEILRTGTFTAMDGRSHDITADMLAEIVRAFDRDGAPVPAVIGHPNADDPAYGWVRDLSIIRNANSDVNGDRLTATLFKVDPGFAASVKEGRYRKVSVKLFSPDAPNNPAPGKWGLRHVGFLGAAAPAVSGLKPVEFAGDETGLIEFQAPPASVMDHPEVRRALACQQDERLIEQLAEQGHIPPHQTAPLLAFMGGLHDVGPEFAFADHEGNQTDPVAFLRKFLVSLTTMLPTGQAVMPDEQAPQPSFTAPNGYDPDPYQMELHARIQQRAQAEKIDYEGALASIILDDFQHP